MGIVQAGHGFSEALFHGVEHRQAFAICQNDLQRFGWGRHVGLNARLLPPKHVKHLAGHAQLTPASFKHQSLQTIDRC